MDRELVERLAREAWGVEEHFFGTDQLLHFAALVAEECAKVCEATRAKSAFHWELGTACAAAIRAKFGSLGLLVTVDPKMPPNQIEFRSDGKVVGRIVGIGHDDPTVP